MVVGVETTQATGLLLTASSARWRGLPYTYTLLATTPDANEKAKLSLYADGKVSLLKQALAGFPVTAAIQVQDRLAMQATLTVIIWDNLRADVSGYWATVGVGHAVVVATRTGVEWQAAIYLTRWCITVIALRWIRPAR